MKHYVTPELDVIKWQQDIVTASVMAEGFDETDGDFLTPEQCFWT